MQQQHTSDYSLTEEELFSYRQHGFLVRRAVFSESEIAELRDAVEAAVQRAVDESADGDTYILDGKRFVDVDDMTVQFEHQPGSNTARVIEPAHHLDRRLEDLVCDERIVAPIKRIVGGEVSVWTNKLNLKRGLEGSGFGWHQDSPYWVHDSGHVDLLPNVYLAFDDATEENGCLRVIDGSHVDGCLPGKSDGSQLGGFFTAPEYIDPSREIAFEVPAGSLVFFDPHIIHGSEPNLSPDSRRAIVMTYQPAGFPMLKTGKVYNIAN